MTKLLLQRCIYCGEHLDAEYNFAIINTGDRIIAWHEICHEIFFYDPRQHVN